MIRTSIMLPTDLKLQATRRAERLGISLGELIRKSLEYSVKSPGKSGIKDPLFADEAVFSGKAPKDLSKNHDLYLYGEKAR